MDYSNLINQSLIIEGDKIVLTFINLGSRLPAKGGGDLKYFAMVGVDK